MLGHFACHDLELNRNLQGLGGLRQEGGHSDFSWAQLKRLHQKSECPRRFSWKGKGLARDAYSLEKCRSLPAASGFADTIRAFENKQMPWFVQAYSRTTQV
jgi:hypothetical protein